MFADHERDLLRDHAFRVHRLYLCRVVECFHFSLTARADSDHYRNEHSGHVQYCSVCLGCFRSLSGFFDHIQRGSRACVSATLMPYPPSGPDVVSSGPSELDGVSSREVAAAAVDVSSEVPVPSVVGSPQDAAVAPNQPVSEVSGTVVEGEDVFFMCQICLFKNILISFFFLLSLS